MLTPIEIHRVTSPRAYRDLCAAVMAKRRKAGLDGRVVAIADPVTAYVNHGRWVIDCDCGAGNSVHPDWKLACCLECGAIRTNIVFPAEIREIERTLASRKRQANRNWRPGETVATLKAENAAHPRLVTKGGR